MLIGLVKDESEKYDDYNWHDVYADEFKKLGDEIVFLDFKREDWLEQVLESKPNLIMWRAWHRPDDRDDAKNKIQFIEREIKIPIFPNWDMYYSYDNKILQNFILKKHGFKIPKTFVFRSKEEALGFADNVKLPLISKCSEGACGDNVNLIETREELKKHIEKAFSDEGIETHFPWVRQRGYVYLQEFLPIDKDLRIITIGEKVELAFWRENSSNWRKNISAGAKINPNNIPEKAKKIAIDLVKKLKFHWCAVDMGIVNGEVYIFEFSSIFGFSKSGNYQKYFGSPNAFILKKQAKYLHNLFEND